MDFENEKVEIDNNWSLWNKIAKINENYAMYNFNLIKYETIRYDKNTTYNKVYGYITGDHFDYESFFIAKIVEEFEKYYECLTRDKELLIKYKKYLEYENEIKSVFNEYRLYKSITNCPSDNRSGWTKFWGVSSEGRFQYLSRYEEEQLSKKKYFSKFPCVSICIQATTRFREYDGNIKVKTHKDCKWYELLDIIRYYKQALEKRGKMSFVEQQRAIMTDKLRYTVLSRDKFKCQICGCSQQDGVKLEVDHIIPVSKGGRTELDNLQTLCERCNRGKRDEMPTNTPVYLRPTQPVSAPISKPTISQERPIVNSPTYYNSPTTNASSTSKMSKVEAKQLCIKNNISISSTITFASSNDSASKKYWANPSISLLGKDWTLILNDKVN